MFRHASSNGSFLQHLTHGAAPYSTSFRDKVSKSLNTPLSATPTQNGAPLSEAQKLSAIFSSKKVPTPPPKITNAQNLQQNIQNLNKRVMKTWAAAAQKHANVNADPSDIPYMPKEYHVKTSKATQTFDRYGRVANPHSAPPANRRNASVSEEREQNAVIQEIFGDSKARSRELQSNDLVPSDFDPFTAEEDDELAETLHLLKEAEKQSLIKMREESIYQKRTELHNPDIADEARAMGIRNLYRVTHLDSADKKDLVALLDAEPDSVNYEPLATFNLKQEPDFKQEDIRRRELFGVNLTRVDRKSKTTKILKTLDDKNQWKKVAQAAGVQFREPLHEIFKDEQAAVDEDNFIHMLSAVFPQYSHQMLQNMVEVMYQRVVDLSEDEAKADVVKNFPERMRRLTHRLLGDRANQKKIQSPYHDETDDYIREFPSRDLEDEPIVHHLHDYLQQPREAKMVKILYAFKKLLKGQVTREEMLIMESLSQKYEPVVEDIKETGDYNFQEHVDIMYAVLQPIIEKDFIMEDPPLKNRQKRTKVITMRATGKGTRKASHAVCVITPGTGILTINGRCYTEYFTHRSDRMLLLHVYKYANCWSRFNMDVRIRGGGTTGQSAAAQLAMVRAVVAFNPQNKHVFRLQGMLTVDKRKVERKKPGQKKARKKFAWVKR